jgi:hypothetical protein
MLEQQAQNSILFGENTFYTVVHGVFGLESIQKKIKYLLTGGRVFYSLTVQVEP